MKHLLFMNEEGLLSNEQVSLIDERFDHPLVQEYKLSVHVDRETLSQLTPEQAQRLILSMQEDYDLQ